MPGSRRKARGAHVVVVPVLTSTEVQVSSLWRSVRSQSLAVSILQEGSDLGGLGTRVAGCPPGRPEWASGRKTRRRSSGPEPHS